MDEKIKLSEKQFESLLDVIHVSYEGEGQVKTFKPFVNREKSLKNAKKNGYIKDIIEEVKKEYKEITSKKEHVSELFVRGALHKSMEALEYLEAKIKELEVKKDGKEI